MLIRKMIEGDLAEVCSIEQETFSDPWSEEDFCNSMREANNTYLVVESEGTIAGYCGYWGICEEGYIYNVAVKKEFRRHHIGYQMLKELINDAKSRGIASLTLEVRISNEPAILLYEALGFERVGIRKDFYTKPKESAVIMWLKAIQQFPL
jgi:ribosomal-protein-alanine N-acetyltransferase